MTGLPVGCMMIAYSDNDEFFGDYEAIQEANAFLAH